MAKEQDVQAPNASGYGWGYGPNGEIRGEQQGVWGGQAAQRIEDWDAYEAAGGTFTTTENGIRVPNDPDLFKSTVKFTPSGRQQDVDRYRSMGEAVANRPDITANFGDARGHLGMANESLGTAENTLAGAERSFGSADAATGMAYDYHALGGQSRDEQMGALALQRQAAMGGAPSQAEILGRGLIGQSLRGQMATAASARGGSMGQMAAQRFAAQNAAGFQQQGMNQLAAMRAGEMAQARDAYAASSSNIRGMDYAAADQAVRTGQGFANIGAGRTGVGAAYTNVGAARTNLGNSYADMSKYGADLALRNRALNQEGRLSYEKLGWDTNATSAGLEQGYAGMKQQDYQAGRQLDAAEDQRDVQLYSGMLQGGTTMAGAYISRPQPQSRSDARAKMTLAEAARLKGQAEGMIAAHKQALARAPAVQANPDVIDIGDIDQEPIDYGDVDAVDMGDVDDPMGGRRDPYSLPPPAMQTAEAFPVRQRPSLMSVGEAYQPPALMGGRANPYTTSDANAKVDAYIRGLKQGSRELKQGFVDWDTEDTAAYRKTLLEQGKKPPTKEAPNYAAHISEDDFARAREANAVENALMAPATTRATAAPAVHPLPPPREPPREGPHPDVAEGRERAADAAWDRDMSGQPGRPRGGQRAANEMAMAAANRAMVGSAYAYKPQFAAAEGQRVGEPNVGPMAQRMAANPVSATAVKRGPDGLLVVDQTKLTKLNSASIASLQQQIDALRKGGAK